ncbi:Lsr2 family protein [Nocardia asteroides]|uniref:Lsr2 family protein n=1 Tax=Nocardia asteroides TaxID=1824 RepID=UPI0037CA554D
MARAVVITFVDDIDGTPADQTVGFGIDGVSYELDLSDANASALREAMGRWVPYARRVGRIKGKPTTRRQARNNLAAIRAWAANNGYAVSSRGRVPATIVEAYEKANA